MVLALLVLTLLLICEPIASQATSLDQPPPCPPNLINFQEKCFDAIPGCQIYQSGTQCQKCDQTSILLDGRCSKTPQPTDFQLFTAFKPKVAPTKNATKQVKMNFLDQINFNNIKNIVVSKYQMFANVSTEPSIKSVLKSSFQTYFLFSWTDTKNRTFLFEFSVNFDGITTQLISDDWDQNLENSAFSRIDSRLKQKYEKQLSESTLTRIVAISKNLYKLHYYSDIGFHYMAYLQKIPFLEIKPLETFPWKYDDQEILNFIYSQHPFLVTETSWNIKQRDSPKSLQYQIKFKSESQIVLQQIPGQRQRIIFFKRQESQTLSPLVQIPNMPGGYQVFRDKEDESIRKVLDHLFSEFSILKNLDVTKIEYQIVAGVNYRIHFKDKMINDEYICKVFYSLSGEINILEIYLNSVLIHSQPLAPLQTDTGYDYSMDPLFKDVETFMKSQKWLTIPSDILYVNKIKKSNDVDTFYHFEIVFEPNSFVVASYFIDGPKNGTILLNNFISNGDNQLDEEDKSKQIQALKEFLQGYRKWLDPLIIEYLKETKPNEYLLKIITESGSYFIKVVNTEMTGYQIYYYELIDEKDKCLTHSNDQLQQFLLEQKLFITGLMNTPDTKIDASSELVSLSENINGSKIRYQLLFVNPTNRKKVKVLAHQEDKGLVVDSVLQENYGLYEITNVELYAKAVEKATLADHEILKDARPIYGTMNSSHLLLYFSKISDNTESVLLIVMNLTFQKESIATFIEQEVSKTCLKLDSQGNCQECKQNTISLMSVCYEQIKNCKKQMGGFCLVCQDEYSLLGNRCTNECGMFG